MTLSIAQPSEAAPQPPIATWLILPSFLIGVPVVTWRLLQTELPRPLASGAPVVATLLLLLSLERVFPLHRRWNSRPEGIDLILLVVNRAFDVAMLAGTLTLVTWAQGATQLLQLWPSAWALPLQVLLGVSLAELIRYAIHRYSHKPGFWWRVHRLHHEPKRLYSLNGPRLHPVNYLWISAANSIPPLLLGAELETVLLVINTTVVLVIFQHSNLNLRFDGLNRFLATPDMHRLHHAKGKAVHGVNYAVVLLVIDRIFGTFEDCKAPMTEDGIGLEEGTG